MAQLLHKATYGRGKTIVLLHGWGLNSGVWQPLVEHLSRQYRVVTVDLPGFGHSQQHIPVPYIVENIAAQVVETVDEPAIYLGWSLGGLVAMQIAIAHQQVCAGLITVASTPCFKQNDNWPGIKPAYLDAFYHQLSKDIESTLNNFLKIQAMGSPHIRKDLKQLQSLIMSYPLPSRAVLASGLDLLRDTDLRTDISAIPLPFLRMYGKLDSLVPKSTIDLVNQLSSRSEHIVFEHASHAPFISHFSHFSETLCNWLERNKFQHL